LAISSDRGLSPCPENSRYPALAVGSGKVHAALDPIYSFSDWFSGVYPDIHAVGRPEK